MSQKPRWTEDEISRLKQIMTRYTTDKEGCMFAAKELGRPFQGVYAKWHSIKPNKPNRMPQDELQKILYTNVSKNPGNLMEAFRQTAEQTNKTVNYITKRYYATDSPINRHKVSACFAMISKDKMASNSKNFDSSKVRKTTKQRVKMFIAQLFGIKKEDL